jgi:hypothetical protein
MCQRFKNKFMSHFRRSNYEKNKTVRETTMSEQVTARTRRKRRVKRQKFGSK